MNRALLFLVTSSLTTISSLIAMDPHVLSLVRKEKETLALQLFGSALDRMDYANKLYFCVDQLNWAVQERYETFATSVINTLKKLPGETTKTEYIKKAFFMAAITGNVYCIQLLLHAQPAVIDESEDKTGRSALMYTAMHGQEQAAGVLLDNHAQTELMCKDGRSALTYAIEYDKMEVTKRLLERGAKPNGRGPDPRKATLIKWTASLDQRQPHLNLLLAAGADPNVKQDYTPLMTAASKNNAGYISLLLQYGADPDLHTTYSLCTALMIAAQEGHYNAAQALVVGAPDPIITKVVSAIRKPRDGSNYLQCLPAELCREFMQYLRMTVDTTLKNNLGQSALELAQIKSNNRGLDAKKKEEYAKIITLLQDKDAEKPAKVVETATS